MLYEFAIDPNILNNWNTFLKYYDGTGVEHGRLISEFPKRIWKKMVYEACDKNNCKPSEKKRIELKLNELSNPEIKEKLVRLKREYDQDPCKCWLLNAEKQHRIQPFHLIISDENPQNNRDVEISDNIEEGNKRWHIETQKVIPRTPEALLNCVSLLFRISKHILFIDPHFRPGEHRYKNTLKCFLQFLHENNPSIERIEYHTKRNNALSDNFWENQCNSNLPNLIPANMSLNLIRWDELEEDDRLHPRYILTDKGGIKIDWGLDQGQNEKVTTDVIIMSNNLYKERWKNYQEKSSPYKLFDELLIKGNRKF